ncbi:LLM class flavin-dependent oxidoreductase [Plantactinospora sp. B24E8]|uniref:LLM class flavin-dependent oxidoreductase n=1 Tax=Plantactinospora sp. B24E8 TaxID=3153567 RepID=UPI00325D5032
MPRHIRDRRYGGRFFRVAGALNVPRSPQGHPLLVQAGSSEDGKELAARYAEAVFTAQQTLVEAQAFYTDLKARTAAVGRDPDGIKILPGVVPVLGATEAQARALEDELERLIRPEYALRQPPPSACRRTSCSSIGNCRRSCPTRTRSRWRRAGAP